MAGDGGAIFEDVGFVWLRLTVVAPWRRERSGEGGGDVNVVTITCSASLGLTVTPAEVTLPAVVRVAVSAGTCEAPMIFVVSGGGSVLTMRREVVVLYM